MATTRQKVVTVCTALCVVGLVSAPPSTAAAVWPYEDGDGNLCNPDAGSDLVTANPPQGLLMLDRSLSMTFYVNSYDSRWEVAVGAITQLTADVAGSDNLRFGLGLWTTEGLYDPSLDIGIPLQAAADIADDVQTVLDSTGPKGLTPMADAITAMAASDTVSNAPSTSFGVLVTDGVPQMDVNNDSDPALFNAALEAACTHRQIAPMYTVGLGSGTNVSFNNVLAAAGGSGTCPSGDPCAGGGHQYEASYWANDGCSGAFQADDQQALINALSGISNQLSCTYSLDALTTSESHPWDDPAQGCAADNYECLDITLGGTTRIHHVDNSAATNIGWRFGDAAHTTIKILNTSDGDAVSADYCSQIQNGTVTNPDGNDVSIKLACTCSEPTGETCTIADADAACECTTGTWACNSGVSVCTSSGSCPGERGQPNGPSGYCHITEGNDPEAIANETNRCNIGVCACNDGEVDFTPLHRMPEICNGIDDDCDDQVDNITASWEGDKFRDSSGDRKFSLSGSVAAAACYERNVCQCPDGHDQIEGVGFEAYAQSWTNGSDPAEPTCVCGASLKR